MDNILKGQWNQITGQIKQTWGELTDDDIARTEGDVDRLIGVVQERYGLAAEKAKAEVASFVQNLKHDGDLDSATAAAKTPRPGLNIAQGGR